MIRELTKRFGIAALAETLVLSTSFGGAAIAQDRGGLNTPQAPITQTAPTKPIGKPVTLRIGPGFSVSAADGVADLLIAEGCPTTVTDDGLFDNGVEIEVGDNFAEFDNPASAGNYALKRCLDRP